MQPSAMTGRILFNLLQVLVVMVFRRWSSECSTG